MAGFYGERLNILLARATRDLARRYRLFAGGGRKRSPYGGGLSFEWFRVCSDSSFFLGVLA